MMLMMMTVNFTETKFVWEERTSTDKILPSDWLTGKHVAFSGLGIIGDGATPEQVVPGGISKVAQHETRKQASRQHSFKCSASCLEFLP